MAGSLKNLIGDLFGGSALCQSKTSIRLMVGLGNPGAEYDGTRHNVGFQILDELARRQGVSIRRKAFGGLVEDVFLGDSKVVLLKPQQYMNRSGHVVATAAGYYKIAAADVIVVVDDLALPVGQLRIRPKGSAGGHNGLKDIIARLGTDGFARLRVGIGQAGRRDTADYVLSRFDSDQREAVQQAVSRAVEALQYWTLHGTEAAMNRYNERSDAPKANQQDVQNNKGGSGPQRKTE